MKRINALVVVLTLVLVPAVLVKAQGVGPWIHIHVTEEAGHGTNVQVNLPLSVVEIAMDAVPDDIIRRGHLRLRHSDISVADLRQIWQELRAAGDAEFVTVEEDDERIRVFREAENIHISVDDIRTGEQKVQIEVPISIVDALLEGEGNELNLRAAISQLRSRRGELVRVNDGNTEVRVWIDERK